MQKKSRMVLSGAALLLTAAVLQLAARYVDGFADWHVTMIYPVLVGILGRISGLLPVSLSELGFYLLLVWGAFALVRGWKQKPKLLACILLTVYRGGQL